MIYEGFTGFDSQLILHAARLADRSFLLPIEMHKHQFIRGNSTKMFEFEQLHICMDSLFILTLTFYNERFSS